MAATVLIRFGALGDVLLAIPVARALLARGDEVHWVLARRWAEFAPFIPATRVHLFGGTRDLLPLARLLRRLQPTQVLDLQGKAASVLLSSCIGAPVRRYAKRGWREGLRAATGAWPLRDPDERPVWQRYWDTAGLPALPAGSVPDGRLRFEETTDTWTRTPTEAARPVMAGSVATEQFPDKSEIASASPRNDDVSGVRNDDVSGARRDDVPPQKVQVSSPSSFLQDFPRPPLLMHPGASQPGKVLPPGAFAALLPVLPRPLVLIGDRLEPLGIDLTSHPDMHDLRGRIPLPALPGFMARSRGLVTTDSGPMHLARALDVPLAALFFQTDPLLGFAPLPSGRSRILSRALPCKPCSLHGQRPVCPEGHWRCRDLDWAAIGRDLAVFFD